MVGAQGGAVCTSSNVKKIFQWGLHQNKKILFIPDQHMGENVAAWLNIKQHEIAYWPSGSMGAIYNLFSQDQKTLAGFDAARLILFASHCAVHSYYTKEMVEYWRSLGFNIVAHPECRHEVVKIADVWGSTAKIWDHVSHDRAGTGHYAVATENHMVQNLKASCRQQGIVVVNVGDANIPEQPSVGCGCATMSRNDPPHLVALLDLLRQGRLPAYNEVKPGDVVNEYNGIRQRLDEKGQKWLVQNARKALEKMIEITES